MAELARNAVDSVLGTIGTAIGDEAKRLGSVRRDMQFIKDEMESMNGFLLDVADPADQTNQVRAWMKQVREVAYNSQSCIDRYVQTVGAGRSSAGLLGSIQRVPRAVLTVGDRYRIANQIREIRSRAQEVGERRQRYGVQAPGPTKGAAQEAEEDDAGRRRALADALHLLDTDEPEVMAWLTGGGDHDGGPRMPLKEILSKFLSKMFTGEDLQLELATTARHLLYNKDPENIEDADVIISEQGTKITEMEKRVLLAAMKEILGLRRLDHDKGGATDTAKSQSSGGGSIQKEDGTSSDQNKEKISPETTPATAAAPTVADALELMKTASTHAEFEHAQRQYSSQLTQWLKQVFNDDIIEELVLCNGWLKDVLQVAMAALGKAAKILVEASKTFTDTASGAEEYLEEGKKAAGKAWQCMKDLASENKLSAPAAQVGKQADRLVETTVHSFNDLISSLLGKLSVPEEVAKSLGRDLAWLDDIISDHGSSQRGLAPRLLAIVTPPADVPRPEDRGLNADQHPATKIAKAVCTISREAKKFDHVVWINAELYTKPTERLQCLLKKVKYPLTADDHTLDPRDPMSTFTIERLEEEIRKCLQGKTFLIVLADHEDEAPWNGIAHALPPGEPDNNNTIIVTPVIQQPLQFHGWYIASWLFLLKASRYKVHFYSHLEALSKKTNGLLVDAYKSKELQTVVKNILKKCRWDDEAFSSKLFLRALYANPRRSENELLTLQHNLEEFSTQRNNTKMMSFCYKDLSPQYKSWLKYLSMFPQKSEIKIRRGSLLRRWAAENQSNSRGALGEAERGLNALVDRGLVLLSVSDCGPDGKPKYCELNPHVFSFITEKAGRADNVAHRISIRNRLQQHLPSSRQHATRFSMLWRRILSCTTPTVSTYSHATLDETIEFLNSLPAASLLLGLIKILDLEGCPGLDKSNLRNICNKLFQLKYLSLRKTEIHELPNEIGKLQDLETFDIRETQIQSFPQSFELLRKLMHLLVGKVHHSATGSDESLRTVPIPHGIGGMTNVQVLSHVEVSSNDQLEDVGKLQQLRKLGVVVPENILASLVRQIGKLDECLCSLSVYIENSEAPGNMNPEGPEISLPRSLQSLNINGKITGLPSWIKKLHRLSRITLCRTSLKEPDIELLGKLVNLRTLVLRPDSYDGHDNLAFTKKEFRQLELLVIEGKVIIKIHFALSAVPKLEKVVWKYKSNTVEAVAHMEGISKLPSLKQIELTGCFDMDSIKKQMHENPSHPVLTEN